MPAEAAADKCFRDAALPASPPNRAAGRIAWSACVLADAWRRPTEDVGSKAADDLDNARALAEAAADLAQTLVLPLDWLIAQEVRDGIGSFSGTRA